VIDREVDGQVGESGGEVLAGLILFSSFSFLALDVCTTGLHRLVMVHHSVLGLFWMGGGR